MADAPAWLASHRRGRDRTQAPAAVGGTDGGGAANGAYRGPPGLRPPLTKRLRPGHWLAIDCVIAALFAVVFLVGSTSPAYVIPTWVGYLLALVSTLPVAIRRLWPATVLGVVLAGSAAAMAIGTGKDPSVAVAFAIYLVALRRPRRTSTAVLVGVVLVTAIGVVAGRWALNQTGTGTVAGRIVASAVLIIAAWVIGTAVRQQRAYAAGLREQAEQRVQAQLAEGRRMRRLLGVLRDDHAGPGLGPAPGLADLGHLIEGTAHAGVQVQLEVRGTQRAVPPGIGLAAYRIVQEALTNVVKHAQAAASRVVVTYQQDALCLEITDDGRGVPAAAVPAGPGHGIAGMRERAALYGGQFHAEPLPGRGFWVAARLPLDSTPGEPVGEAAT